MSGGVMSDARVRRAAELLEGFGLGHGGRRFEVDGALGAYATEEYQIAASEVRPAVDDVVETHKEKAWSSDVAPWLAREKGGGISHLPATAVQESRLSVPRGGCEIHGKSWGGAAAVANARKSARGSDVSLLGAIAPSSAPTGSTSTPPPPDVSLRGAMDMQDGGDERLYSDASGNRIDDICAQYSAWMGGFGVDGDVAAGIRARYAGIAEVEASRRVERDEKLGKISRGLIAAHRAIQIDRQIIEARRRRRGAELGWHWDLPFPPQSPEEAKRLFAERGIPQHPADKPDPIATATGKWKSPYPC